MLFRLTLILLAFGLTLGTGTREAQAFGGIGLQGGLNTPTRDARDLLEQELQLGIRVLLPPYTPFGLLRTRAILLDIGLDLPARVFGDLGEENVVGQMANLGVLYRLNLPVSQRGLIFLGGGVRVSTMVGLVPEALSDMLFLRRFTGGINVAGGFSYLLAQQLMFDVRVGYGVFGFEYWEATGGLVFLFR